MPTDDDDGTVPVLRYAGQSGKTARELAMAKHMRGTTDETDISPQLQELANELRDYITGGEPCPQGWTAGHRRLSSDVYKAAEACGYSKDKAKRVKDGIGARAKRDDDGWQTGRIPDHTVRSRYADSDSKRYGRELR